MKILHYSLGIPGFRSGGLTKYSIDLMKEEVRLGNEVFLLYPGEINDIKDTTYIKKDKDYNGINVFEIINPLPVSLVDGVKDPQLFYLDKSNFKDYAIRWLSENGIDIVHVHTLMGLPIEFVKAVKKLGIKIIFTTHDYYGICPKVNLIRNDGSICNNNQEFNVCAECCRNGLSYNKIKIMQSKKYRLIKNFSLGKKAIVMIKKMLNKSFRENKNKNIEFNDIVPVENYGEYQKLNAYYYKMFKEFDYFHFNSKITKKIYEEKLGPLRGEVISITHADIKDNRNIKKFDNEPLNIVFLGNQSKHKGLNELIDAINSINSNGTVKCILNIWGTDIEEEKEYLKFNGKYKYEDLENIFNSSDLLVIPSMWYETFGFIGLEAYSYSVPILSTNLVGFNDLIQNDITGFITEPNVESIKKEIIKLIKNRDKLVKINKNICESKFDFSIRSHAIEIIKLYKYLGKG